MSTTGHSSNAAQAVDARLATNEQQLHETHDQGELSPVFGGEKNNVQILDWDSPDDPANPVNWSNRRKWIVTASALFATLMACLNGTSITVAAGQINEQFHVSDANFPHSYWPMCSWSLGGAVFIILFLPMMEDLGVRIGFLINYVLFIIFIIPQAVAPNFATLIVTRFFSGGCASLLANTIASVIPDVWSTEEERSVPVGLYILLYLWGSTLGPPVFAAVTQFLASTSQNWRWIFYIQIIVYVALFPIFWFTVEETRGTVILRRRAKKLRNTTGNKIYTETELNAPPIYSRLARSSVRPIMLLFTEPVLLACTLWSAFSFGTVFLFTQSIAQVFSSLYGFEEYSIGYLQTAVVIGEGLGWFATLYGTRLFLKSASRNTECPGRPIPEARLYVSIFGTFVGIVGGMFVYAWTSYPDFPWIAPAIGLAMVGFGIMTVVSAVCDYITDAYAASNYAGSAIGAVAFGENNVAAFLPLAAQSMYTNLGFQWASTLLAFLALLLGLAPIVFVWKGRWFREKSPFMQSGGEIMKA
jgi:MFS family permease